MFRINPKSFIFVFLFSSPSFAGHAVADRAAAWAACNSLYATHTPTYWGSYSCRTHIGAYGRVDLIADINAVYDYWSFTVDCSMSGTSYYSDSHTCEIPVTCSGQQTHSIATNICLELVCTAPQVLNSTTHVCDTPVVTCPSGQYKNSSDVCVSEPTCAAGQYNLNHVCTDVPDCNVNSSAGGNYFDYASKSCVNVSPLTLCIDSDPGTTQLYCPPIEDCKPSGYICANDPTVVAAALVERTTNINTAKAAADASAAKAAAANAQSQTPVNADLQAKQLAQVKVDAAKATMAQVQANANATSEQLSAAVSDLGNALDGLSQATQKLNNASASQQSVQLHTANAQGHADAVPTSPTSGHAADHATQAANEADAAESALNDTIAGNGEGSGTSIDTTGLAQDSSIKSLGDKLDKMGGNTKSGNYVTSPDSFYESKYPDGIAGVWASHSSALNQTAFISSINSLTPGLGGVGSCPSWSFDVLSFGSFNLEPPCQIWAFLRVFFIISTFFYARSLIFGG